MIELAFGDWTARMSIGEPRLLYADQARGGAVVEQFDLDDRDSQLFIMELHRYRNIPEHGKSPSLIVAQRYSPSTSGFNPGVLITDDGTTLFIGAGTRVLAYDLLTSTRLWEETANFGFWNWQQHGAVVLMAAELEFAAWTSRGDKLWAMSVEPPWYYSVVVDQVHMDMMGSKMIFPVTGGPSKM